MIDAKSGQAAAPRCGAGRQRTVSPSETRIALTSLVTGATPDRHGIIEINISTGSRPYRALSTRATRA
ncbi:alkaline phosphatase family protein [Bradyrhizobium sp. CW1]|uniref:alkaline phosphatase family protein n=1 Tax=Bradyrhizobium sp. CW1 TaxID=2782686 RepID=UPI00204A9AD1|nr:alkaline phosphatase family protein [Bradyrhizobium sp. CW1]